MTANTVTILPTPAHRDLVRCSDALAHAIAMLSFLSLGVERQRETIFGEQAAERIEFGENLIHQHILETLDDAYGAVNAALEAAQEQQGAAAA